MPSFAIFLSTSSSGRLDKSGVNTPILTLTVSVWSQQEPCALLVARIAGENARIADLRNLVITEFVAMRFLKYLRIVPRKSNGQASTTDEQTVPLGQMRPGRAHSTA